MSLQLPLQSTTCRLTGRRVNWYKLGARVYVRYAGLYSLGAWQSLSVQEFLQQYRG